MATNGTRNVAPHSYFNAISSDPLIVHFTSTGVKDTLRNVRATGEFVINVVDESFAEQMNVTASNLPEAEDEFVWAGLGAEASRMVAPPRVAGIAAALECTVNQIVTLGNGNMVFGDVACVHVAKRVLRAGRVAPDLLRPIARFGGSGYTRAAEGYFEMRRPSYEDLLSQGRPEA